MNAKPIVFLMLIITCSGILSGCVGVQKPVPSRTETPVSIPVNDASVNGKYAKLIQKIHCPSDVSTYGQFNDYGYWRGGNWCGKKGVAGYWVWINPTWYVWKKKVK